MEITFRPTSQPGYKEAITETLTITMRVKVTVSQDADEYRLSSKARRAELKRVAADYMIQAMEALPRVEDGALFEIASA